MHSSSVSQAQCASISGKLFDLVRTKNLRMLKDLFLNMQRVHVPEILHVLRNINNAEVRDNLFDFLYAHYDQILRNVPEERVRAVRAHLVCLATHFCHILLFYKIASTLDGGIVPLSWWLKTAARHGNEPLVRHLLTAHTFDSEAKTAAFECAAADGQKDLVDYLAHMGVDTGRNAATWATENGHLQLAQHIREMNVSA